MSKTRGDQAKAGPKVGQVPPGNLLPEDDDDSPGKELTKGARVWRTYVKETDRWDKEMVDERNNSLDVLLIFAALFSAISTSFIIESLGDLKPDPVESSAKTLEAISQKMDAIISGQQSASSPAHNSDFTGFTPSYSAILVNILWLVSLSLSIAVSLIAMLAKEWCHKFMLNRTGETYHQARKRQQKWNGIEKWKMQEVLQHLPGLMHSALLLFAIGLCIYLWDINVSVAIPVTAITSIAACIYMLTTVLPLFDQFCPYSTPATLLLNFVALILGSIRRTVYSSTYAAYTRVDYPKWLESVLQHLAEWLEPKYGSADNRDEDVMDVSMDNVTSQMLAWMLVHCDDSRSVDVALQAICGAGHDLPHQYLAHCRALELLASRLGSLTSVDVKGRYDLKDRHMLEPALRYCCAYSILISGDTYKCGLDSWSTSSAEHFERYYVHKAQVILALQHHTILLKLADEMSPNCSMFTMALARYMTYSHWDWDTGGNRNYFEELVTQASSILTQSISKDQLSVSEPAFCLLLESCAHYMIRYWPQLHQPLFALLVCTFLQNEDVNPGIACAAAIVLAATAFSLDSCPSDQNPLETPKDRQKRAAMVLRHYQRTKPDSHEVCRLFTFGFIGLLPRSDLSLLEAHPHLVPKLYSVTTGCVDLESVDLFTLPATYTWVLHLISAHILFQPLTVDIPGALDWRPELALAGLLLRARLRYHQSFIPALVVIRLAQSKELRDACTCTLMSLPLGRNQSQIDDLLRCRDELSRFFSDPPSTEDYITSTVVFYFRLLVANVMLCSANELSERQDILRHLFRFSSKARRLQLSIQVGAPPNEQSILEHVAEDTSGKAESDCMFSTMQLIANFCQASTTDLVSLESSFSSEETPGWVPKLEAIKRNFRPSQLEVEPPELDIIENLGLLVGTSQGEGEHKSGTTSDYKGEKHLGHMTLELRPYERQE
ncbi:transmembrane protein [Ceratobasidium sp. AG-Ba]|nr:transmembrane protein [Ceratobasidium sp. AG-Ba]